MSVSINGTNGLTFNDGSAQTTAASGFGFKNRLINGNMVIDQRNAGASVTPTTGTYTLDRYRAYQNVAGKFTVQRSTTAPTGFINSALITSTSAYTASGTDLFLFMQYIEGLNCADLAWGTASAATVTLSFWVRSSLTGTFGGAICNSAEDRNYPFTYTISVANTWEQKSITIPGDTSGTWLTTNGLGMEVNFGIGAGSTYSGTAGAWAAGAKFTATGATSVVGTNGATWYITGVQLEKGSTATSFDYRPYGTELALCQRYAQPCGQGGTGRASSSTGLETTTQFRVPMRATPTISFGGFSGAQTEISQFGVGSVTVSAVANSGFASSTGSYLSYTTTGATTGSFCACIKGDTSFANAEL